MRTIEDTAFYERHEAMNHAGKQKQHSLPEKSSLHLDGAVSRRTDCVRPKSVVEFFMNFFSSVLGRTLFSAMLVNRW